MSNVIPLRRKPRPLKKAYQPNAPYEVEREDQDDGSIIFWVADMRPDIFRTVCHTHDDQGRNPWAKFDADQIAKGLNMLVQYGMEKLPKFKEREDDLPEDFDDAD